MTSQLTGIGVSDGIAIAKAYRLEAPDLTVEKRSIDNPADEIARFESAKSKAAEELEAIRLKAAENFGEDKAAIFAAHLLVLNDPELTSSVTGSIEQGVNAEFALQQAADTFTAMFESMDNEYMRERAADVRDVTKRLLAKLLGVHVSDPSAIDEEVIIIADDLTPSATAQLNKEFVKGFVTNIGGRTSHSAILGRMLEIPAVVGTKTAMDTIEQGVRVIVDGTDGTVLIDPADTEVGTYEGKKEKFQQDKELLNRYVSEATTSSDGQHVEVGANIASIDDLPLADKNGAEGVGLFRTEFLYMGQSDWPSEEEQLEAYKAVLTAMDDRPTVVRTLDIGGDKELNYFSTPEEMNPFLGERAIRLCFAQPDMFRTQLRALLRASVHGNLKIMFPMIATLEEFRQAKQMLLEEEEKLKADGFAISDTYEVGMMLEIPAAAVIADLFAKEVDFFSIGTNDLIQYTMAADRMNESVSYLYQPNHPAVLRLIHNVISAAHKEGKWAGMCGEVAGDPLVIPILLGMGLDEFSMSPSSILKARAQIAGLSKAEWEGYIPEILQMGTSEEIIKFVQEHSK
ncbi:phosphoenolpyruvate-protein phosphotransferase [Sporosarcina sp. NCCP-2716]|uniref:phosphoenolpyruvate--protein phosphotransferase n=1 Tax=Sporosarcina sp. NCCP-2716 TaxID=2943679 RepID=UPI0020413680|nr:phosphoenolpyruvate--protein phosphotransferase [Sporosarcina sp. NCCP-2716]GKV68530.1 phosphoenolpyruvate-protein phosphotransferase [Sporosarcina sp. NCCP-2716]